jgi:4-carboxymuconolactone decarboxylase
VPESYLKGLELIAAIDPESGPPFVEEFAWGKIHARNVLEPKVKELIAIANLISLGDGREHLRLHIQAAYRVGCTTEEIIEVIIQSIVHVGFTKALIALHLVKEVGEEMGVSPPKP